MLTTRMLMKCSEQCLVLTHQVLQRQAPTGQIIKCNGWPCFHPQKDTQTCVIHYAPLLSLRLPPVLCRKSRMQCSAVQCRASPIPSLRVASSASSLSSEKDFWLHPGSVGLGLERAETRGQEVDILSPAPCH